MKLLQFPQDQERIRSILCKSELASLLVPSPLDEQVEQVCQAAKDFGVSAVVVTPYLLADVSASLQGSGVDTVCINSLMPAQDENFQSRMFAIHAMLDYNAAYIDLTAPVGMIRDRDFDQIHHDFSAFGESIHKAGAKMSIIIETGILTEEEQVLLGQTAVDAGADYIRICSGMDKMCGIQSGRANLRSIGNFKKQFGDSIKLKAGGGWDYAYLEDCYAYMQNGAERVDIGPRTIKQLIDIDFRRQ